MNKSEKQFSNRGHSLSRFVDDYRYQEGNKRHDSSGSEDEFINRFRSDYISQNASGGYISRSTSNGNSNFQRIQKLPESVRKTSHSIQESSDNNCIMMNTRKTEPVSDSMPQYKDSVYNYYKLEYLVGINIDEDEFPFIEYSFVLKNKILESMDRFSNAMKEKLELLCELTDGTQLEKHQRSITNRMRSLVHRDIIRPSSNVQSH